MAARRPYVRPMQGWWKRNPFFVRYMARELTAFVVAAYAVVLLVGVVRLSQGERAFGEFVAGLRDPWSVGLHMGLLAIFVYHTWSWFSIMPKTMPPVVVAGRRLSAAAITGLGLAAAVVASVALLLVVVAVAR